MLMIVGEGDSVQPNAPDPTEPTHDATEPSGTEVSGTSDTTEPPTPTEPSGSDATEPDRTDPTDPTEVPPEPTEAPEPTDAPPDVTEPPEPTEPQAPTEVPPEPTEPPLPPEPTVPEASVHTHSYAETVVAPTCTEDGYTSFVCSCGDTFRNYYVSRLEHEYGEWVVTKEPTKEATGERQRTCGRCRHVETDFVAPLDEDTGEKYESYIDPRLQIIHTAAGTSYCYDEKLVMFTDYRTWGEAPSIYIEEGGALRVVYFLQDGTKVEQTVPPLEDYYHVGVIYDSGKFALKKIGNYS